MTQHAHLDPSPFLLPAGLTGIVLIHGYTGSPPEMRLVADYLHGRGLTVSAPCLPGHGATPQEMNCCRWRDWADAVENALVELRARCRIVFVGGLSMGSLLALNLAVQHPELPGVILYSPATWLPSRKIYLTPLAKHLVRTRPKTGGSDLVDPEANRRLWSYDEDPLAAAHELLKLMLRVRRRLPQVTCPLLIIHSTGDAAIHPLSAQRTYARAGSAQKKLITLTGSGHCITVDCQWEAVAGATYDFVRTHGG